MRMDVNRCGWRRVVSCMYGEGVIDNVGGNCAIVGFGGNDGLSGNDEFGVLTGIEGFKNGVAKGDNVVFISDSPTPNREGDNVAGDGC
jgi:hypothetical protein